MDQITHDVRTAQWAEIVRSCHERPADQTAKNWLNENGMDGKQYYYWQRRLLSDVLSPEPATDYSCQFGTSIL